MKRLSYRYVSGFMITSIILVIFSYLFQPIDYSKDKYLKGYVSSITPDLINPISSRYGGANFEEVYKFGFVDVEELFFINRYDGAVEKYGIYNIVNKNVTIRYYNFYSSSNNENYNYVRSLKIGNNTVYTEETFVSTNVFWMVLGLTILSCFLLVWGIWQRLKEEFS
ncbi:hypothetical protein [Alistipes sp. ZOR0009]|uniref:hypothetical protein n=1 Tax=Alistipes sp. ZOR0009 TaxID=1339253 RepID=UPI0012E08206|nr:hypothetical protein [Alistipes sp. ZOR0009]